MITVVDTTLRNWGDCVKLDGAGNTDDGTQAFVNLCANAQEGSLLFVHYGDVNWNLNAVKQTCMSSSAAIVIYSSDPGFLARTSLGGYSHVVLYDRQVNHSHDCVAEFGRVIDKWIAGQRSANKIKDLFKDWRDELTAFLLLLDCSLLMLQRGEQAKTNTNWNEFWSPVEELIRCYDKDSKEGDKILPLIQHMRERLGSNSPYPDTDDERIKPYLEGALGALSHDVV